MLAGHWCRRCHARYLHSLADPALITQDVVSTKRAIETYDQQDTTFASTREAKFLHAITDAFDQGDAEAFTGAVAEYDR